jgi:hypothetical protein
MAHAELAALVDVVQRNCDLADARHAREKSMCTYLLDMREHFRWAAQLPLGAAPDRARLSEWIAQREQDWEKMPAADATFAPLPLAGGIDPFDDEAANRHLAAHGWLYGAGIGLFGAPLFFLAERASEQMRDGARVVVTGRELARGMAAPPAVSRGHTVIVRLDALRRWLWTRVEAGSRRAGDSAFAAALRAYPGADAAAAVERMALGEVETLILHELGELRAGALLGAEWERMIAASARRTELVLRAVRDLLADCLVTLPQLLARDARASLLFWYATFDGLRRQLAPELAEPFRAQPDRIDCAALDAAARAGATRWFERASGLRAAWQRGGHTALAQAADALCPRQ